jgi:hypothetical protein
VLLEIFFTLFFIASLFFIIPFILMMEFFLLFVIFGIGLLAVITMFFSGELAIQMVLIISFLIVVYRFTKWLFKF